MLRILQEKSRNCGLSPVGSIKELTERIDEHLRNIPRIVNLLSFDLGYRNLAYAHLNIPSNELLAWNKLSIELPQPFCPRKFRDIFKATVQRNFSSQ